MFGPRTLFIVGAGASKEAALPTGNELKATIADKIVIKFEFGSRQATGSFDITEALREHVREADGRNGNINPYLEAGWLIGDAMPQAISIDNFIDAHQGNENIELCGKLAIVQSILEAERKSLLFYKPRHSDERLPYKALQSTWYSSFMQLLTDGCHKENISQCLERVSFIIFNYDRCIEHFLFHALQTYYGIDSTEAANHLRAVKIFHPYGVVGQLPWQVNNRGGVSFGSGNSGSVLLSLSGQIKTFTERIEDETSIAAIRELVQDAETVVFLGFAFHRQNMELIKPSKPSNPKHVFATAKGISNHDCTVVKTQISDLFEKKRDNIPIYLNNKLECHDLFGEYWRSLSVL